MPSARPARLEDGLDVGRRRGAGPGCSPGSDCVTPAPMVIEQCGARRRDLHDPERHRRRGGRRRGGTRPARRRPWRGRRRSRAGRRARAACPSVVLLFWWVRGADTACNDGARETHRCRDESGFRRAPRTPRPRCRRDPSTGRSRTPRWGGDRRATSPGRQSPTRRHAGDPRSPGRRRPNPMCTPGGSGRCGSAGSSASRKPSSFRRNQPPSASNAGRNPKCRS